MIKLNALNDTMARVLFSNQLARVDRNEWLYKTLAPFVSQEELTRINHLRPEDLISPEIIDKLASEVVNQHTTQSSFLSAGFTVLGRNALCLATSCDVINFWVHQIRLVQKLAYLYGWDNFYTDGTATQETLARLTAMIGYGMEVYGMKKVLLSATHDLSPLVSDKLNLKMHFTSKNEGMKLVAQHLSIGGKTLFATLVARRSSLVGAVLAGTINLLIYKRIARRIKEILQEAMYTRLEEVAFY